MFFIRLFLANTWKKIRGSPSSFKRKGEFSWPSSLVWGKSLMFCMCTRSLARADDAKIVRSRDAQCQGITLMHLSMLCPRGGPRDRVGTLIKNKNLESNFLTLGIRFQFKVPPPWKTILRNNKYAIKVSCRHGMRWRCSFHFCCVTKNVVTLQLTLSLCDK